MLVIMYGVIGEMTSPGAILPGMAGAIALVLLMYLASILPMTIAGLALVGLATVLFAIDLFAPTHGLLTLGGMVAFAMGVFMLFDRGEPFLRLSLAWILPATALTALFFIFVAGAGIRAQRRPARTGAGTMIGRSATAVEPIGPEGGRVSIEGEYWNAVSLEPVAPGQPAEIIAMEGLTLRVKPGVPTREVEP
jgi:membrane-bound serine protease (ClpP class)